MASESRRASVQRSCALPWHRSSSIHGVALATHGIVEHFGGFLTASGLPAGAAVAWAITVVEIVGGVVLALGLAVRPLTAVVRAPDRGRHRHGPRQGRLVRGGSGRNGAEYSALIIACLLVVALTDSASYKREAVTRGKPEGSS